MEESRISPEDIVGISVDATRSTDSTWTATWKHIPQMKELMHKTERHVAGGGSGAGALASVPGVFRESFGDSPAVADGSTFEAAGKEVQRRLEGAGLTMIEPYVFPAEPPLYAEYGNIEKLRGSLREHDAIPVAVGSGTINDIVKRSAHECERPYMCVATAASMDGYTAFGASIEKDGLKQTLSCPAPRAVVADLEVLKHAPGNMTAWGSADPKVLAGEVSKDLREQVSWSAIEVIGGALPKLTERGIIGPEDFPLMRHLHSVVGLDEPLDMPWHTFFGANQKAN